MLAILFVLGVGFISDIPKIYLSNVKIILLGSSFPDRQSMNGERAVGKVIGKKTLCRIPKQSV